MTDTSKQRQLENIHLFDVDIKNREIYLHSAFDGDNENGIDYRVANRFIKNLDFLNKLNNEPIKINLCIAGGEWEYGMGMYDAIMLSPSPTNIVVHGNASSMASIIVQAGTVRSIMPNADIMVHYGSMEINENSNTVISAAKREKQNIYRMLEIYADRCKVGEFFLNKTKDKIISYIRRILNSNGDWYMDAKTAKYYGFVDVICGK